MLLGFKLIPQFRIKDSVYIIINFYLCKKLVNNIDHSLSLYMYLFFYPFIYLSIYDISIMRAKRIQKNLFTIFA